MRQTCSQRFKLMETNMLSKTKSRGHVLLWRALSTLSRDGNLHSSGTSHVMTASPKPSFRAPWRADDTVIGRGKSGWRTSKSGRPCTNMPELLTMASRGNDWKRISAESSLTFPDDPLSQGNELKWTVWHYFVAAVLCTTCSSLLVFRCLLSAVVSAFAFLHFARCRVCSLSVLCWPLCVCALWTRLRLFIHSFCAVD